MTSVFMKNTLGAAMDVENISLKCQSGAQALSKNENDKTKCMLMMQVFITKTFKVT
mgnify:FL=1|jgi:hypothetical protein